MLSALDAVPSECFSGDIIPLALVSLTAAYPAADFDLAFSARRNGSDGLGVNSVTLAFAGDPFSGSLNMTGKAAGVWAWTIRATLKSGSGSVVVAKGVLTLRADPASADAASHAEKMLAQIEALLEGKSLNDVASYAIAGRSLTRLTPAELMTWRSHYQGEVRKERARAAGNSTRQITLAKF